ncbi:MAG: DUF1599 domain-containing protein [Prevotella sp.]|nr:DUF1599 domain-containing protein [Prevotella sp.]
MSKAKVNVSSFKKQTDEMNDVFAIKNRNYGNSFEISLDKYGIIAALTRLSDKFNRLETLILKGENGTNDESVADTLIDLASYSIMTAVYLKGDVEGDDNETE